MSPYEMTFIVRPDLDEEQTRAVSDQVTARITAARGESIALYAWSPARRRLAFPIRDFGDGFYFTTTFRVDPPAVRDIENALKLNDRILRFLIVQATDQNIRQSQQRMQQATAAAAPSPAAATPQARAEPVAEAEPEVATATPEMITEAETAIPPAESETEPEPLAAATTQPSTVDGEE